MIYICEKWVSRHRKYRVYFELQLIDGKKCEAGGPTAIGLPFSILIYMGKRPGPIIPDSGAYAVAPYASGSHFLTVRVGRNSIRPIRRPRQGDEGGCPVISQGNLWGSSGPYRARLWGVCCCALRLRSIVWDYLANRPILTPHKTSPTRGRMRVPGYFAGQFIGGIRALFFICHGVGASPHRPPPPFLVLTQEKEAKEGQGYGHPS